MNECYIVTNQNGHFLSKQKDWVDGRNSSQIIRSKHRDEAINLVFEMSSKDIYLRAEAISCKLDDKKHPVVEVTNPIIIEEVTPETEAEVDTPNETATANNHGELAITETAS